MSTRQNPWVEFEEVIGPLIGTAAECVKPNLNSILLHLLGCVTFCYFTTLSLRFIIYKTSLLRFW